MSRYAFFTKQELNYIFNYLPCDNWEEQKVFTSVIEKISRLIHKPNDFICQK